MVMCLRMQSATIAFFGLPALSRCSNNSLAGGYRGNHVDWLAHLSVFRRSSSACRGRHRRCG